jgi:hypothetical protein
MLEWQWQWQSGIARPYLLPNRVDFMVGELPVNCPWAEILHFRKPWFLALLLLTFMPGCLLMIWTGDTYYRKKGVVYRMSRKERSRSPSLWRC